MLHISDQSLNNLWGSAAQLFHAEMEAFFQWLSAFKQHNTKPATTALLGTTNKKLMQPADFKKNIVVK